VTAGASYKINKNLEGHLAVLWVIPGSTTASNANAYMPIYKGSYDVTAFVASLGLGGRFGN